MMKLWEEQVEGRALSSLESLVLLVGLAIEVNNSMIDFLSFS